MHNFEGDWFPSMSKCNYKVEMMMSWQQCSETQVQVYAEFPGQTGVWIILYHNGFYLYNHQKVQHLLLLTGR